MDCGRVDYVVLYQANFGGGSKWYPYKSVDGGIFLTLQKARDIAAHFCEGAFKLPADRVKVCRVIPGDAQYRLKPLRLDTQTAKEASCSTTD